MIEIWRNGARFVAVTVALTAISLMAAAVTACSHRASWTQTQAEMEDRLAENPGDAEAWAHLAVARYILGAYGEAVCAAEKATEADPKSGDVWREYGMVMVESWGRAKSAPVRECFRERTKTAATRLLKICEQSAPGNISTGTYLENCRSAIAFFGWIGEDEQRRQAYTMAVKRAQQAAESSSVDERQTGEAYLEALSQLSGVLPPGDNARVKQPGKAGKASPAAS